MRLVIRLRIKHFFYVSDYTSVCKEKNVFQEYESLVRSRLPDKNFATMVSVLQKFFNFMNLTASVIIFHKMFYLKKINLIFYYMHLFQQNEVSSYGIAATEKVIKFLKMSDARIEEEKNELPLPALEDTNTMLDLTSS